MDPSTTSSQKNLLPKDVTMYGWTDVSTYIYICMYVCMYVCNKLTEFGGRKNTYNKCEKVTLLFG